MTFYEIKRVFYANFVDRWCKLYDNNVYFDKKMNTNCKFITFNAKTIGKLQFFFQRRIVV